MAALALTPSHAQRIGRLVFVHAGLGPGPVEPQLEQLRKRDMSTLPAGKMPPPICNKAWMRFQDAAAWGESLVVSGHHKVRFHAVGNDGAPPLTHAWCGSLQFKDKANHVASHRLVFDSGTCAGRGLNCAVIDPSIDMFREPSSDPNVEYFTVAPTPLPAADNTA